MSWSSGEDEGHVPPEPGKWSSCFDPRVQEVWRRSDVHVDHVADLLTVHPGATCSPDVVVGAFSDVHQQGPPDWPVVTLPPP